MGPGIWRGRAAHHLPGRLRVRLPELRGSAEAAERLLRVVRGLTGVVRASVSQVTGSLLIHFDESILGREQIGDALGLPPSAGRETAATAARQLALTGGALAAVAAKRLLLGPSALSRTWGSYDFAGIVTVAASYPFLRSGVQAALAGRGLSGDLVIGLAGLAATVMRENLWGLTALFLTSLTHWLVARTQASCQEPPPTWTQRVTQDAARQAHLWGRISLAAAALTGLATGNWRRALAALIAAAPAASALSATLPLCAATAAAGQEPSSRLAVATAQRNLRLSALMNGVGLCMAAGGLAGPLTASLWHNLTSLTVLLSSLPLLV